MSRTDPYIKALHATWPALRETINDPWILRDGAGGGKRASAITALRDVTEAEIDEVITLSISEGTSPLFMIRPGDNALDNGLAKRSFDILDRSLIMAADLNTLTLPPPPPSSAFQCEAPLEIQREIWREGDVNDARQAVMDRVNLPKTWILGRAGDRPAGAAFAALHRGTVVVHAMCVSPAMQRLGVGRNMLSEALQWARDMNAERFSLMVAEANAPARKLYASVGLKVVGKYHYRTVTGA